MTRLYVRNKRLKINPSLILGSGGEAEVYDIGQDRALKLFKQPDHPDIKGIAAEEQAARLRLAEKESKLACFPAHLPQTVISPEDLVFDEHGRLAGYTMKLLRHASLLLRYGDKSFREGRIGMKECVEMLLQLHSTVSGVHRQQVVIGDFNDLNVMVEKSEAFLIDADSFQFGPYRCSVFTERFVDPLLCDPALNYLLLTKDYSEQSDWYAYAVMVFRSLLYVEPYGGVYKPQHGVQAASLRPLKRITVFHPDVRYPKPAKPLKTLSDDLLQFFEDTFVRDRREPFPVSLLNPEEWSVCAKCGLEHARRFCPLCSHLSPTAWQRALVIHKEVSCRTITRTPGVILHAALNGSKLEWLTYEEGVFKRETGEAIARGGLLPGMRAQAAGSMTVLGAGGKLAVFRGGTNEVIAVDTGDDGALFDTSQNNLFYVAQGILYKSGALGRETIGSIISGQARFWSGPDFGFGYYRAQGICRGFVFSSRGSGLNDSVQLAWLRGQVLNARCVFGEKKCWFFATLAVHGKMEFHVQVIGSKGELEAHAVYQKGSLHQESSWLGALGGMCAIKNVLLAATDEGLIRLETEQDRIVKTRDFPDTEPFLNSGVELLCSEEGVYVVGPKEIHLLKSK